MSRLPFPSYLLLPALVISALAASPAYAATFVVNSTDVTPDVVPGDGVCDDGSGACTLRAAIDEANADAVRDLIEFAIPGPGPHSIPDAGLRIDQPVVIDGYTQPGASKNTAATGTNAVLAIVLEGDFGSSSGGILVYAADVELRGLWLRDPSHGDPLTGGTCIYLNGARARVLGSRLEGCGSAALFVQANNARIGDSRLESRNLITDIPDQIGIALTGNDGFVVNNLIGTDATGTLSLPSYDGIDLQGLRNTVTDNWIDVSNTGISLDLYTASSTVARNHIRGHYRETGSGTTGVWIAGSHDNQIGLPSPNQAQANRISGFFHGVELVQTASGNRVQGNLIGVEADGTPSLSNINGVFVQDANGNTIGEPPAGTSGAGNWIAFNSRGLVMLNSGALGNYTLDNSLRANRFWGQAELPLQLGEDPVHNDDGGFPPDQDEGPNHLQNPPRISSVTRSGGTTRVQGVIAAQAGSYTLDFYSNDNCALGFDPGGKFYLGEAPLVASPTSAVPLTSFDVTLPVNALGNGFTAMATDATGNSSQFSGCFFSVQAQADLSVAVTADPSSAGVGDDVVFTVALKNAGPLAATGVSVQVPRPPGFSDWTAGPAGSYDESTGQWLAGNLVNGATTTLTLTGRVASSGAPASIEVHATAGQGSTQVDPDLSNNTSSARIDVLTGAHLRLSQTAPASAGHGEIVSFVIDVTNDGPEDALGVSLSGRFDAGLVSQDDPTSQNWIRVVGDLARDEMRQFTVQALVADTAALGTGLSHMVTAATVNGEPRLSTQTVGVGTAADLSVSTTTEIPIIDPGGSNPINLLILVSNSGPDGVDGFKLKIEGCFENPVALDNAVCNPIAGPPSCAALCVVTRSVSKDATTSFRFVQFPQVGTAGVSPADGMTYYDPDRRNDEVSWASVRRQCGLTGIEAVFGIGLLALVRRTLRGRSRQRLLPVAALLLAVAGAVPQMARALPIAFAVDTAASSASFALASPLGSPPAVPVALSGSASADVALAVNPSLGLVATSLQLTGAALAFSNASLLFSSPPLYALTFASSGLGASLTGPSESGFPVGPGLSLFDFAGSALEFDAGTIAATGTYFGAPVDATFDFSTTPYPSVFPNNSVAQLRVMDLGSGNASLRLSFPFSAPLRITVDDIESTVTIAGTLVLNGVAIVPEPASGLLVGCGLAWLALRRRRAGARRA